MHLFKTFWKCGLTGAFWAIASCDCAAYWFSLRQALRDHRCIKVFCLVQTLARYSSFVPQRYRCPGWNPYSRSWSSLFWFRYGIGFATAKIKSRRYYLLEAPARRKHCTSKTTINGKPNGSSQIPAWIVCIWKSVHGGFLACSLKSRSQLAGSALKTYSQDPVEIDSNWINLKSTLSAHGNTMSGNHPAQQNARLIFPPLWSRDNCLHFWSWRRHP